VINQDVPEVALRRSKDVLRTCGVGGAKAEHRSVQGVINALCEGLKKRCQVRGGGNKTEGKRNYI